MRFNDSDNLEAALRYGLTQAQPGSAAWLLAREVVQLRPIADEAAALTHGGSDLDRLRAVLDTYQTGSAP